MTTVFAEIMLDTTIGLAKGKNITFCISTEDSSRFLTFSRFRILLVTYTFCPYHVVLYKLFNHHYLYYITGLRMIPIAATQWAFTPTVFMERVYIICPKPGGEMFRNGDLIIGVK